MSSEPMNYIMMPGKDYADPSVRLHGLTLMGVKFKEAGNSVKFIFKSNRFYDHFLDMYEMMTDADKTNYYCRQYKEENIRKNKALISELLSDSCANRVYYEDDDSKELFEEYLQSLDESKRRNVSVETIKYVQDEDAFRLIEINERLPLLKVYTFEF